MTCTGFDILGAGVGLIFGMGLIFGAARAAAALAAAAPAPAAARPPAGLVVPSRLMISLAAALRMAATPGPIPRSASVARRPELSVGRDEIFSRMVGFLAGIYLPFLAGLAVLALSLKALAVGAPLVPGLRIFSPDPAAMRAFLAWMLAYSPGFMGISTFSNLLWHVRHL